MVNKMLSGLDAELTTIPSQSPNGPGPMVAAHLGAKGDIVTVAKLEDAGASVAVDTLTARRSEEIKMIAFNVLRTLKSRAESSRNEGWVVVVTSARDDDKRPAVSLNLAVAMARWGTNHVVFCDGDRKSFGVSTTLGLLDRAGYSDVINGSVANPHSIAVGTEVNGLSVIGAGFHGLAASSHGNAIAIETPLEEVVDIFRTSFPNAIVVIDAPPCLSSSDPSILSTAADMVVLVVEAEKTERSIVESALEIVGSCPATGIILNDIKLQTSSSFGMDFKKKSAIRPTKKKSRRGLGWFRMPWKKPKQAELQEGRG